MTPLSLNFEVDEFVSFLKALPPQAKVGVSFALADRTRHTLTAGEMRQLVLSSKRQHLPVEEQHGSYYFVHLHGFSEGTEGS